jgi:hypothetical protein
MPPQSSPSTPCSPFTRLGWGAHLLQSLVSLRVLRRNALALIDGSWLYGRVPITSSASLTNSLSLGSTLQVRRCWSVHHAGVDDQLRVWPAGIHHSLRASSVGWHTCTSSSASVLRVIRIGAIILAADGLGVCWPSLHLYLHSTPILPFRAIPVHPLVHCGRSRSLSSKHLAQVSPPSLLPELVPALASFLAL